MVRNDKMLHEPQKFEDLLANQLKNHKSVEERFLQLDRIERQLLLLMEQDSTPLNAYTLKVIVWKWQFESGTPLEIKQLARALETEPVIPANITLAEKEIKKEAAKQKIPLASQNKIDYALNKLVGLGLVDRNEQPTGKREKFRINYSFLLDWRNAKQAFYEKLDNRLLSPLAVSTFEKELYGFHPNEYVEMRRKQKG